MPDKVEDWNAVLDRTSDIVYLLDTSGNILDANAQLCKVLRQTRDQLIGTPLSRWLEKDSGAMAARVMRTLVTRRLPERSTRVFQTPDRETLTYEVNESPIIEHGEVHLIGGIGRDITQEAILERKLWDTVEARHQAVDFAIRTSLGLVKGYVYTLGQSGELDQEKRRRYVRVIEEEMEHLSIVIEDMLDIRRADAGAFEMRGDATDPVECIRSAVKLCQGEAERRKIQVLTKLPVNCDPIHTFPEALQRVSYNVIQYAIQQTLHSGTVRIELTDGLAYLDLLVFAEGAGVDQSELPHLFDRYHRAGIGNGVNGLGTSLAITRTLTNALGGKIWVNSTRDHGIEFRVMIPRRIDGLDGGDDFVSAMSAAGQQGETSN